MLPLLIGGMIAAHVGKHVHRSICKHLSKHASRTISNIAGGAWSQGASHVHKHTADYLANQAAQNGGVKFK